jgi:uncharacterized protein (DUF362 family)
MMEGLVKKRKVIIRRCEAYDVDRIASIIKDAMAELGETPRGRILIKPNVVTANKGYIHHSYTEPRVVEAMVTSLRESNSEAGITIGESGGIAIPTRMFFTDSGYYEMGKRLGVPVVDFNEEETRQVALDRARWHKTMAVAKSLYEADYKIWMPKLKFHIVAEITNALKLNVGILTHKERFLYHDDRLNEKIVDLLEIGYPDLIVTDAVIIGKGFESSPYPVDLGALIISNDPIAVDMVAARILNYGPETVRHLVEASRRGYGSLDFDDIEVSGDVTIEELAQKTRGIESPFQELQKLETPIHFYEGINRKTGNICYGGCICSVKGVLGTAEKKYPGTLASAKKGAMVMGYYKGDVIHPGETVALIGDCTEVTGRLDAGKVIRFKGCPATVKDLMMFLLRHFGIKSPAYDFQNFVNLVYHSAVKGCMQATIPFRKKARITRK